VFAVKVEQSGGLIEACEVAKIAKLAGIDLYGGTMLEGRLEPLPQHMRLAPLTALRLEQNCLGHCCSLKIS
jgi:hypothetical protein